MGRKPIQIDEVRVKEGIISRCGTVCQVDVGGAGRRARGTFHAVRGRAYGVTIFIVGLGRGEARWCSHGENAWRYEPGHFNETHGFEAAFGDIKDAALVFHVVAGDGEREAAVAVAANGAYGVAVR